MEKWAGGLSGGGIGHISDNNGERYSQGGYQRRDTVGSGKDACEVLRIAWTGSQLLIIQLQLLNMPV